MTIKESLKKIYKALSGGKTTESRSISSILNDISTVASGGSGGGGDTFYFKVGIDQNTGDYISDKTYQEVWDAYSSGKNVVCKCNKNGSIDADDGFTFLYLDNDREYLSFSNTRLLGTNGGYTYIVYEYVNYTEFELTASEEEYMLSANN